MPDLQRKFAGLFSIRRGAFRNRFVAAGLVVLLALSSGSDAGAANPPNRPPVSDANSIIAGYLVNFVRYVEWPETEPPAGQPWRIGLLNAGGELRAALEREAEGKTVRGRKIAVVSAADPAGLRDCQIVLLPAAPAMAGAASALATRPVLTVVYRDNAPPPFPVAIELVKQDRRMRYHLNAGLLAARELRPTPGLLENALPPAARSP